VIELPYLTTDIAGVAAVIKRSEEDFRVEELPLYELEGAGDHVHFLAEKRGQTTNALVREVARKLDRPQGAVGYAGLKDAQAVTRQWLSIEHVTPETCLALELSMARVLVANRHRNKLKRGHLAGNRFTIVLRECDASRIEDVQSVLTVLERVGLPNSFGPQRFGARGDSARIGSAILQADHREAIELISGRPGPLDFGAVKEARELFDSERYAEAARAWPRGFELSAKLCGAMDKHRGRASRAIRALSKREKAFYISAWQSELFNRVLAARMPDIDKLFEGEFAWNHGGRRAFEVRDLAAERARALRFEVSAAGPLFGPATRLAAGRAGNQEREVLEESGVALEALDRRRFAGITGGRRALRVRPTEVDVRTLDASSLELRFCLPEGAFATSLLREILKEFSLLPYSSEERPPGGA